MSFSLLQNFSASKYYEAAQAGSLTGAPSYSVGVLVAPLIQAALATQQYVFGNAPAAGNAGLSFRQAATTAAFQASQGTVVQASGTTLADATDDGSSQALANTFKSVVNGSSVVTTGPVQAFPNLKANAMALAIMVVDGTNQTLVINGAVVAVTARNATTSANPFRIGLSPDGTLPMDSLGFAGAFYHSAALTVPEILALQAAAAQQQDIPVNTLNSPWATPVTLDYVWSTKISNPDARASWVSRGGAASPITMVRHGTWVPGTDTLAVNYPWGL